VEKRTMTALQPQSLSFEEYLAFQAEQDLTYELHRGELVPVPIGRSPHGKIARFLEDAFRAEIRRLNLPLETYRGCAGVTIPQYGRRDTAYVPDLMVVTAEQDAYLDTLNDAVLAVGMIPPLIVEVVSAGTVAIDHRYKRRDYNAIEVPEYWIVDFITDAGFAEEPKVTVCTLVEGLYETQVFHGGDRIQSSQFPDLAITAEQVLQFGFSS
jgi:Uma2 family endonuclease